MKDFTPSVIFAIAEEVLGVSLWVFLVLAFVVLIAFVIALMRQRGFRGPAARVATWTGVIAGVIAAAMAPFATQAGFANLSGALDWALLALAGLGAMLSLTVLIFAMLGSTRAAQA